MFGFLPTDNNILSNTSSTISSLLVFIETFNLLLSAGVTLSTFDDNNIFSNCLFIFLCSGFTISGSAPGIRFGKNSTTETFEPRDAYTCPSSRPITPPPTISRVSGTSGNSSAVREVRTDGWFSGIFGSLEDVDPAAIMHRSNSIFLLSSPLSTKSSVFDKKVASPFSVFTFLTFAS